MNLISEKLSPTIILIYVSLIISETEQACKIYWSFRFFVWNSIHNFRPFFYWIALSFSQFVGAPFLLQLLITCFSYVLQIFPLSYFLPSVYVYGTGCHTIFSFFNLWNMSIIFLQWFLGSLSSQRMSLQPRNYTCIVLHFFWDFVIWFHCFKFL